MKKKGAKPGGAGKLTRQQGVFVEHYLISMNGADAVRAAGYKTKDPRNTASVLLSNPKIQAAIDKGMAERVSRLRINQDYVVLKLVDIVESNIGDFMDFGGHNVRLRKMEDIPREKVALIKEISETEIGFKISLPDKLVALEKLARHLGMFERHRQSRKRPDDMTRDVLERLRAKEISPVDAALILEAEGIPLPESVRLLLSRVEPEPPNDDNGEYATISPGEMAERAKRRDAEIEGQESFVKERMVGVEELKTKIGGGSFHAQKFEDGVEDGKQNS